MRNTHRLDSGREYRVGFEQMRGMADPDSPTGQPVIVITHDVE